jgi:pyruvate formate lyase activating enzyme
VDHWICDLKIADGARHKIMTGVDGTVIRNNLDWLAGKRENILVRMPLIPGVNDPPDDLDALAAFLAPMQAKVVLEIMPYHRLGESKYERLGRDYPLKGFRPPAEDHVESARNRLRNLGLQVVPAAR